MESQIAALDQQLIGGLSYRLPDAVDYIKKQRSATFWPEGAAQYSPTQVRTLRFTMADASVFVDPSTAQLAFTITNTSTTRAMQFLTSNPLTMFSRVRLLMAGTLIEQIDYFGRWVSLLDMLEPFRKRLARYGISGVGALGNDPNGMSASIPAGGTRKVCVNIPLGLFGQHLYIPTKYAPITLEFELGSNVAAYLNTSTADVAVSGSQTFTISDCRVLSDVVLLDGAMENKVAQHLSSGKTLPLHVVSWVNVMNNIPGLPEAEGTFSVQLARAYTRIKTIMATLSTDTGDGQIVNDFAHPNASPAYRAQYDTLTWRFHIGSETMPDYPVQNAAETFYHLQKAMNMQHAPDGVSLLPPSWMSDSFVICQDLERAAVGLGGGAEFTGMSTRGGETIRFEVSHINSPDAASVPQKAYLHLQVSFIVNIGLSGVELFE